MARVAVVTGGTAGIGLATAELFAARGWSVAVIARDQGRLDAAKVTLEAHGRTALAISADVANADAIDRAAADIEAALGPIRAWVNNAMSTVISPADEITADEYRRVTETTYLSQVFGTLAALRHMKPRNRGVIVQVSSGLAIRAAPLQAAYCGAKFAVTGFTDALRSELIHQGSRVSLSTVYLPAVNTPQFDWERNKTGRGQYAPDPVFDPRLCAEAIVEMAERPQRDVWVGRSTVMMAAAQTFAPALADRKAAAMWPAQLAKDAPSAGNGNLFDPVLGFVGIDGRFGNRTKSTRREYWTSRERDLATTLVAGAVAVGAAGLLTLLRSTRKLTHTR